MVLVEMATGRRVLRIETGPYYGVLPTFSPDCRMIATANRESFIIWDTATGKELFRRPLPEKGDVSRFTSYVSSLTFLPHGDGLATGLIDGTILIWDVSPALRRTREMRKALAPAELDSLWSDLAREDASKAYRAAALLAADPAKTVSFLKERLRPVATLDEKEIQSLLTDLDSDQFAVRERASKKLASFGEQAEPALRQALEGKPSLEARKRLEALHADAELAGRGIVRSAEVLRTLRAIRVLEHIGDREARQVLQKLADGDPAARSTQQAKEALRCLDHRAAVSPGSSGDSRNRTRTPPPATP